MKVTISDIAQFFKKDKKTNDATFYGKVASVVTDTSGNTVGYNVSLGDGDSNTFYSRKLIGAEAGDTVKVTVSNGVPVVTARIGGDKDAVDAQETAEESAKTATSYITDIDEENGIKVSAKDNENNYVQIDSDGMSIHQDIEDVDTEVATFGGEVIELGKGSETAVIKLCENAGRIVRGFDQNGITIESSEGYAYGTFMHWDLSESNVVMIGAGPTMSIGEIAPNASITLDAPDVTGDSSITMAADEIFINGKNLSDFITAKGTSNNWNYIKYANGTYEAWRTYETGSTTLTNATNGAYSYANWTEINAPSFASTASHVIATCRNAARFVSAYTTSSSIKFKVYACASVSTAHTYTVDLHIRGTWS